VSQIRKEVLTGFRKNPAPFFVLGLFGYGFGHLLGGSIGAVLGILVGAIMAYWLTLQSGSDTEP
jgi:hypothetical protein